MLSALTIRGGGDRFALDPMVFVTELDGWQVEDTFPADPELRRFRILAIDTEALGVPAGHADAI